MVYNVIMKFNTNEAKLRGRKDDENTKKVRRTDVGDSADCEKENPVNLDVAATIL